MIKFNVGDRVRRLAGSEAITKHGSEYEVVKLDHAQNAIYLAGLWGGWDADRFELVKRAEAGPPLAPRVDTKLSNPKEAIGAVKMNFHLVPDTLPTYACMAFTEGAYKYGAYNWRVHGVRASTYYSALNRHIKKWWNGEDCDPKTRVPHLANAVACIGIILDANFLGMLTDDRPPKADIQKLLEESEKVCAHLRTMVEGLPAPHHCTALEPACPPPAG